MYNCFDLWRRNIIVNSSEPPIMWYQMAAKSTSERWSGDQEEESLICSERLTGFGLYN